MIHKQRGLRRFKGQSQTQRENCHLQIQAIEQELTLESPYPPDIDARAAAAVRWFADCQSDPRLAAAIVKLLPRPPGRPSKKAPSKTDQRNDLLRALRANDPRFRWLKRLDAAKAMRREMADWIKLTWPRLQDGPEPEREPNRTYWRVCKMGFTRTLEINTLKNVFSGQ